VTRREVPVDWDMLDVALTWSNLDFDHYLDVTTGEVVASVDEDLDEEALDAGIAEGRYLRVEPLSSSIQYGWMSDFADDVGDARLRKLLDVALGGRGAFRRFVGQGIDGSLQRKPSNSRCGAVPLR
jgi:hypothetical protein